MFVLSMVVDMCTFSLVSIALIAFSIVVVLISCLFCRRWVCTNLNSAIVFVLSSLHVVSGELNFVC